MGRGNELGGSLPDKNVTAAAEPGFACKRYQHRIENVLVVQFEAGHSGDLAVLIFVLQGQVSDLGLDEAGWQAYIRYILSNGGGRRLNFMRIAISSRDRTVRNEQDLFALLVAKDQSLAGVVEVEGAIHLLRVPEDATLIFRADSWRRGRWRRHISSRGIRRSGGILSRRSGPLRCC